MTKVQDLIFLDLAIKLKHAIIKRKSFSKRFKSIESLPYPFETLNFAIFGHLSLVGDMYVKSLEKVG